MTERRTPKLEDLHGPIANTGWFMMPDASLRFRARLGLSVGDVVVANALLGRRVSSQNNWWPSVSQDVIAKSIGFTRQSISRHLARLVRRGLIARRADHRFGGRARFFKTPYRYNLVPYLACLSEHAASGPARSALLADAHKRFSEFVYEVGIGAWEWRIGELSSSAVRAPRLAAEFRRLYRVRLWSPDREAKSEVN